MIFIQLSIYSEGARKVLKNEKITKKTTKLQRLAVETNGGTELVPNEDVWFTRTSPGGATRSFTSRGVNEVDK